MHGNVVTYILTLKILQIHVLIFCYPFLAQGISSNVLHLKIKTSSQISDIPQSLPLPSKFISKEDRLSGLSTKIPTTYSFTQPLHSISASSTRKSYMAKDFLNTSGANVRPSALSSSVSSTHRRTESSPNPTSTLTSTVISLTLHNRNGHFVSSKGTFSLQIPVSSFVKGQTHQALPVTSYQSNNTQKSSGAATISISSQTLKFTPSQNVDSLFSQKAFKIPLKHRSAKTSSFPPRPSAALSIPSFTTSHASPSSSVTKQSSLLFRSDLPELHTSHKAASTSKLALNTGAATLLFKSQPSSKQLTTLLPIKPSFVKESKSETSLSKSISQMLTAEPILTSSSSKTEPQLIRNSVTSRMSQSDSTYLSKLRTAVNQPSLSSLITSERNPSQQISDIARLTSMSLSQSSVPISYDISGAVKALTFITAIGRFKSTHATLPVHSLSAQSFAVSAPTTTNNLPVTNKGTISGIISTKSSTFITSLNPTVTLKSTDGQTTMFIGNSMYLNQSSVFKTSTRSQPATTMASLNPMTAFREVPTTNTMIKQNTGSTHSSKVPVPPLFIFVSRRVNRWNSFTISSSQNFPLPDSMVQSISSSWTTNKIITKVNQLSPPSFTSGIYQPLISFDTLQSKASEATISFASIVGKQRDISFTLVPHNTAEASSTNRAMGSSSSSLQARTISSHFITTTTSTFDPALSTRKPTIRPPQGKIFVL